MSRFRFVVIFLLLCTPAFAQRRQPNKPSEPNVPPTPTGEPSEEKFPPEAGVVPPPKPEAPKSPFEGMKYRLVGPFRGGRALAVAGVPGEDNTYYFGAVAGGMWKTTDGGLNWKPLWDKFSEASPSVGAIAIAPSDPNVIYVGTGEACIRGNIVMGNGVYKSTDAGKTWKYTGLRDTHSIGRMIVHPKDPNTVYVAALGHPFGPNTTRGIFRSRDGGKTWQRVLYVDDKTGGIDIQFDLSNPSILFAGMWQTVRKPWTMESGGPGSGLYRSADGGDTWTKLSGHGLPDGTIGRIGVATTSNPNRIYALIEAEKGGLFRSDDAGEKWQMVNDDRRYRQRAWYYTHVFADPKNPEVVYILNTGTYRSIDGGKTFSPIHSPHGDNHGFWIDPENPKRLINGNDGGATISIDGGATWSTLYNQPTAQFYHITSDDRFPYWIYGAQQDNSTVAIASASPNGGIDRSDYYDVGGGESGYIAPDPKNPEIVYAGSYGGDISRYDHRTGETQAINPWPRNPIGWGMADLKHRFQWTEPIVFSPHDLHTLYYAGEVLFKTTDEGKSWTIISPDLTRNDKSKQQSSGGPITKDNTGVEVYDTIFSVVESPVQAGLIWAGSDDGLIHLTRNGGTNWEDVTPKAMPEWGTVSMIEASPTEAGTAYVAIERHKMDDFTPYILKTSDFGKTWTSIVNGIPKDVYVHAVRIDPKGKGMLYAGTERGVYVSFNDGANWQPLQMNLPIAPVNDLIVKNNDLAIATHGRSFWILDDLSPVRQWNDSIKSDDVHLFTPADANHTTFPESFFGGGNAGQNPPPGAVIYYFLKTEIKKPEEEKKKDEKKDDTQAASPASVTPQSGSAATTAASPEAKSDSESEDKKKESRIKIEILDSAGKVIRTYPPKNKPESESDEGFGRNKPEEIPSEAGINRFVWDLHYEGTPRIPNSPLWGGSTDGPLALPGDYQIRLTVDGKAQTQPFKIVPDPRLQVTAEDLKKQFDLMQSILGKVTQVHDAVRQIRDIRAQLTELNKRLKQEKNPNAKALADAGEALDKKMKVVEEALIQTKAKSGQDVLNYPIQLNNLLVALGGVVSSADAAPTKQDYEMWDDLSKQADEQLAKWNEIVKTDLASYNRLAQEKTIPIIGLAPPTQP
ncbi:MAG TPA: hypothetical protein VKQ11_13320 [Candidatus Sulfotelmatobacter sp.]|nr:hypothetical protein [Candidatus Sulfotelmatobacter sp.]